MNFDNADSNKKKGFIKVYRSLKDHWLWEHGTKKTRLEAWIWLLLNANAYTKKSTKGNQLIEVKEGQILVSKQKLSLEWRWHRTTVDNFLLILKNDGMITYEVFNKYTLISIKNINIYQKEQENNKNNGNKLYIKTDTTSSSESTSYTKQAADKPTRQPTVGVHNLRQQNVHTHVQQNVHNIPLNDNELQETGGTTTDNKLDIPTDSKAYTTNNNTYYNLSTTTTKGENGKNNGEDVEKGNEQETFPPAPSSFSGYTAMAILPLDECLEAFMSADVTRGYRDQIEHVCYWMGKTDLMYRWGKSFNFFLVSELNSTMQLAKWCQRFGWWLGKISDRNNKIPEEYNILNNSKSKKYNDGKQPAGNGTKTPKFGGIPVDQGIEFRNRFTNNPEGGGNDGGGEANSDGDLHN